MTFRDVIHVFLNCYFSALHFKNNRLDSFSYAVNVNNSQMHALEKHLIH